jgi:hypothetical protein
MPRALLLVLRAVAIVFPSLLIATPGGMAVKRAAFPRNGRPSGLEALR